jgi:hypothetical protein
VVQAGHTLGKSLESHPILVSEVWATSGFELE